MKDGVIIQQCHTVHDIQLRNCSPVWPALALKTKVNESPFVTLLIDLSKRQSTTNSLLIYIQTIDPESFQPGTHFVANKDCVDTSVLENAPRM